MSFYFSSASVVIMQKDFIQELGRIFVSWLEAVAMAPVPVDQIDNLIYSHMTMSTINRIVLQVNQKNTNIKLYFLNTKDVSYKYTDLHLDDYFVLKPRNGNTYWLPTDSNKYKQELIGLINWSTSYLSTTTTPTSLSTKTNDQFKWQSHFNWDTKQLELQLISYWLKEKIIFCEECAEAELYSHYYYYY
ncbi:hypothetical protein DFA_02354 [Cavenderia fasciculata]|uniref:Uncharacterized protein n=1 Tax=Cavenderia fasciculata TaxID=261658 RepID=F4PZ79_CACFS|nr:uncharacterized protein DFA_02354 [Cavenderia fasciculata]EGG19108.1 hypothetical protein DFA_02354 [Cavenderia fasciculata]|eukprot:XP_004366741.1 hypothetical protein DFA_02354 [Cavenderia fasciculata]